MSDLENFQASESWRTNFKKFLFMERKPEIVQSSSTVIESQRYSLDIGEDLKNLIEQKKNKKTRKEQLNLNTEVIIIPDTTTEYFHQTKKNIIESKMNNKENMNPFDETVYGEEPIWQKSSDESFEKMEKMCEKTVSDPNSTLFKYLNEEREQESNNVFLFQKSSDESFEALERMCDKTASDPNSTLFQYLHSDRKEQVLAKVKKCSAEKNINDNYEGDNLLMKINNCTLLDEVEAPSRMWENTICGDTIFQTSPVKIVGLLRPSTIIEEAPDDSANSDISSQMSFRSATKTTQSDVSLSAYETADDFTGTSRKHRMEEFEVFDVDQMLLDALAKNEQEKDVAEIIPSLESMEATIVEEALFSNNFEKDNSNESIASENLIDFEKTFRPLHGTPHNSMLSKGGCEEELNIENELENNLDSYIDESIIEILTDDEDDKIKDLQNVNKINCNEQQLLHEDIKTEMKLNTNSINIIHDAQSFNEPHEGDKDKFGENDLPSEKSMKFNDTMEEVEYMLKKGMEYMAAEAAAKNRIKQIEKIPTCGNQVSKGETNSLTEHMKTVNHHQSFSTSQARISTTPAKKTPLPKGQSSTSKRFDIDIRPFPKLDIFAKPLGHTRTKDLTSKNQKFSHIVSPIGTYMKKTAQTPLMSSINCKNKNYFNSTAIMELEKESRLYQPQFSTDSKGGSEAMGLSKLPGLTSSAKRPLPKKAYISSDLKHIVDERTPVTIPGGKKIQKYIENAMMPAVLRHEGKLKMTEGISSLQIPSKLPLKVSDTNSTPAIHVPPRNNASLADLSLMSGDVSMYTIMDAQKF